MAQPPEQSEKPAPIHRPTNLQALQRMLDRKAGKNLRPTNLQAFDAAVDKWMKLHPASKTPPPKASGK